MENLCSFLKSLFVVRKAEIDSSVFRLHYKVTFSILLALSIAVGWRQQFGTAINCKSSGSLSGSFVDDFCYTHATYSVNGSWDKKVGEEIPYPGVDKRTWGATKTYHTYYQWVAIVLFLQAVFFKVPRCFWKHMESGRVQNIIKGMAKYDSVKEDFRQQNLRYMTRRLRSELHRNWKYFFCYIATAVLNLVNVILQIYLMDVFLRGQFFSFGYRVVQFSENWSLIRNRDPGLQVFPKMAQCDVHTYGSSGDVQRHTVMCLLPINDLNEKIYVFLWFWFFLLAVVSCLPLLGFVVFCVSMRFRIANLMAGSRLLKMEHMRTVVSGCNVADCLLIRLVSQNLSSKNFRDLVVNIATENTFSKIPESEMSIIGS